MKSAEESMQILEAFDLTGSFHAASALAGCSHHTVARLVAERDAAGGGPPRLARPRLIDELLPKIEEWVEQSKGRIRADVAHEKLLVMGFTGSERSSRRAVAAVKKQYQAGNVRMHRPWVTEPGLWLQYDFGDDPGIDGRKTVLFCARLAWSRYRIVIALRDRTIPTVHRSGRPRRRRNHRRIRQGYRRSRGAGRRRGTARRRSRKLPDESSRAGAGSVVTRTRGESTFCEYPICYLT